MSTTQALVFLGLVLWSVLGLVLWGHIYQRRHPPVPTAHYYNLHNRDDKTTAMDLSGRHRPMLPRRRPVVGIAAVPGTQRWGDSHG